MNTMGIATPSLPLAGLKVIDFSELLPGPFFTQNLLELGASVTKIERPPHGDSARRLYPGIFASVNRGKESISLDLKQPEDKARAFALLADADVLVEGYRPGVMVRLGLDYEKVAAINPTLVYVSLSGYGQAGPYALRPGHDINYLASAGAAALAGSQLDAPAAGMGLPVADLCGAMYALSSTLAALLQRQHTGRGQLLDVSLTDCVTHWMNPRLGQFGLKGLESLAQQRHDVLCKPAYGVFAVADGHVSIAALEDHFWTPLNEALGLGLSQVETQTYGQRVQIAETINRIITQRVRPMLSADVVKMLDAADIPVSKVEMPASLHQSEHARARNLFVPAAKAENEDIAFVRYPVMLTGMTK